MLLKQSMDKLHPIILVILFFILMQFVMMGQLIPLWQQLSNVFQAVPYSKSLLFTAFLFVIGEMICALLDQFEYEAIATVVKLSIRITVVSYWLKILQPAFQTLVNLLERFM
ncbi:pyruvate formate-lyase [Lysinibacillus sp. 2017]|uniref:pyruvate formate-lyase n=1 Tax=Lysinibacillus sp. 2017 TaxID=2169540 RepID=UPI001F200B4B|nr:pyruvate formate-lyase [Lysinibacillus sp. 2017]